VIAEESISPVAINFVDVHRAARKIIVGREIEGSRGTIISEGCRSGRVVGIVNREADFFIRFIHIEKQKRVIDAQRRETNHVDDGGKIVLEISNQLRGHLFLIAVGERHEETPMSALEIAFPGPAALGLEQRRLNGAERPQIRITRYNDLVGVGREFGGVGFRDFSNQLAIGGGVGDGQVGIKASMFEELFRGAGHDEAMVEVVRRRVAGMTDPIAFFIVMIFPDELVGKSEGVRLKIEGAAFRGGGGLGRAATRGKKSCKDKWKNYSTAASSTGRVCKSQQLQHKFRQETNGGGQG
jgi:hypothetical protein